MGRKHKFGLRSPRWTCEAGGVALEYVMVSSFAGIVTLAILAFLSKTIHHQLQQMADRYGVEAPGELWNFDE